ncbi:MAG: DinB family protein [Candidatus Dormibacterales bacterium]
MPAPPRSVGDTVLRFYRLTHQRLLTAAGELSPDQFAKTAGPSLHSVAWQLWHAARWDDVIGSFFHRALAQEPRSQVWDRESLVDRWSMGSESLGLRSTGTRMSDEAAEQMRFPSQDEVIRYAGLAFGYTERAVELIPDDRWLAVPSTDPDGDTYLDNVLIYLEHLSRHLGMIESIRGLQGPAGASAT